MRAAIDTGFLRGYFERMHVAAGLVSPGRGVDVHGLPPAGLRSSRAGQHARDRRLSRQVRDRRGVVARRGGTFTAIDVFDDLQARDGSSHDVGIKGAFLANLAASFPTLDWLRLIAAPSATVRAEALGPHSFCHIDGLHSAEGTYSDMRLCADVVVPGGLVALDDYFNQRFPGVSEGALLFERRHPRRLDADRGRVQQGALPTSR